MNVLIINAGSSSLKYQLMDPETGAVSAKGLCERIYIDGRLTHNANGKKIVKDIPMPTHSEAIQAVLAILVDPVDGVIKSTDEIDAVAIASCTAAWSSLIPASSTTRSSPPLRSAFLSALCTTLPT